VILNKEADRPFSRSPLQVVFMLYNNTVQWLIFPGRRIFQDQFDTKIKMPAKYRFQVNSMDTLFVINLSKRVSMVSASYKSVDVCLAWVWTPVKSLIVSLIKNLYPYCSVLVVSRNGMKVIYISSISSFTIKL